MGLAQKSATQKDRMVTKGSLENTNYIHPQARQFLCMVSDPAKVFPRY